MPSSARSTARLWLLLCAALLAAPLTGCGAPEQSRPPVERAAEVTGGTLAWQAAVADSAQDASPRTLHDSLPGLVRAHVTQQVLWTTLLVGFFAALAFGSLLLWIQDQREPAILALALLALLACVRSLVLTGAIEHLYEPYGGVLARTLVETSTLFLLPASAAFLLWTSMPWAFAPLKTPWGAVAPLQYGRVSLLRASGPARALSPSLRLLNTYASGFALLAGVGLTVVLLLVPHARFEQISALAALPALPMLVVLVLVAAEAAYVRLPVWPLFTAALLFLALATGRDLLIGAGLFPPVAYWLPLGLPGFFVLFGAAFVTIRARVRHRTEQRNAELAQQVSARSKELQTASQAAQAAYLARSQFLTAISHELRTPLAAIMGYANLLEEELDGKIEPQQREFLRAIAQSGDRLLHLIDDLLDLSRIEAGRFALRPGPVDANGLARDVHLQLYPLAREKGLQFEVESRLPDADATFVTDGTRLRQVLVNLVSNAVKFTPTGHVRLVVAPAVLEDRPAIRFRVEDTGVGVSPEFMPQLFDRFTQETRAYGHAQRGTGLGLHLSKELVTRLGGTIEVESEVGGGSVFTVTMPLGR